jgi:protein gp37
MAEKTGITWTDHTFNPWWGCVKVSPGCDNCYAESDAHRYGHDVWGKDAERRFFGEKHWNEPKKWNQKAAKDGVRRRVFCASMADVFEDNDSLWAERTKLFRLIDETPNLDWLLLTKRPASIGRMMLKTPWDNCPECKTYSDLSDECQRESLFHLDERIDEWRCNTCGALAAYNRQNVWLGTTVESDDYRWRIDKLIEKSAIVHFLSIEPQIGPVDLEEFLTYPGVNPRHRIDWVIIGGESGHHAREYRLEWARDIIRTCRRFGVAVFNKQLGTVAAKNMHLIQRKGADPNEWPEDLRVQEFPVGAAS